MGRREVRHKSPKSAVALRSTRYGNLLYRYQANGQDKYRLVANLSQFDALPKYSIYPRCGYLNIPKEVSDVLVSAETDGKFDALAHTVVSSARNTINGEVSDSILEVLAC